MLKIITNVNPSSYSAEYIDLLNGNFDYDVEDRYLRDRPKIYDSDSSKRIKMSPSGNIDKYFDVQTVSWTISIKTEGKFMRPGRGLVVEAKSEEMVFASGIREREFRLQAAKSGLVTIL